MQRLSYLAVAALLLVGVGCNRVKVAYAFADDAIESRIEDYLELTPPQEQFVGIQVDAYVAWHKRTMLPRYADYLNGLAKLHESGEFSRETFDAASERLMDLYGDTVRGGLAPIAHVLRSQDDAQLRALEANLRERAAESEERARENPKDALDDRVEGVEDAFEEVLGDLTPAQQETIRSNMASMFSKPGLWVQERKRRHRALLTTLKSRPSQEALRSYLERYVLEPTAESPREYREYSESWQQQTKNLIFDVLSGMTASQRSTLIENLRSYARDLDSLAV